MKIGFGIVSYLPSVQPDRNLRVDRLLRLLRQLSQYWPAATITIIAQNWETFTLSDEFANQIDVIEYPRLGILKARLTMRDYFLNNTDWDYVVLCDDDCIIQCDTPTAAADYWKAIEEHPDGFCFIKGKDNGSRFLPYAASQLNLCAISRYIFNLQSFPLLCDVEVGGPYEDRIFAAILHFMYGEHEFDVPDTIRHIHYNNKAAEIPSTWWKNNSNQNKASTHVSTNMLEQFIAIYHRLPEE